MVPNDLTKINQSDHIVKYISSKGRWQKIPRAGLVWIIFYSLQNLYYRKKYDVYDNIIFEVNSWHISRVLYLNIQTRRTFFPKEKQALSSYYQAVDLPYSKKYWCEVSSWSILWFKQGLDCRNILHFSDILHCHYIEPEPRAAILSNKALLKLNNVINYKRILQKCLTSLYLDSVLWGHWWYSQVNTNLIMLFTKLARLFRTCLCWNILY